MTSERSAAVRRSALWAAYGDALGFISELTDERGLARRLNGRPLTNTTMWRRRVGGRFGVELVLPAGTYSDDTQLRLATGRAIGADGRFDVEAFSKVELPLWPAFALGGGKATKAAAAKLARSASPWFANSYVGWLSSGGNGAAMRVQPHAWATPRPGERGEYLVDVFKNAITTHGHPRAIFGAVLHALTVGRVLQKRALPDWRELVQDSAEVWSLAQDDNELRSYWLTGWERASEDSFEAAWKRVGSEAAAAASLADEICSAAVRSDSDRGEAYRSILESLRLLHPSERGSGIGTVIAALFAAYLWQNDPVTGVRSIASVVGSDTDTIATMFGASIGPLADDAIPGPLLDHEYVEQEAKTLALIGQGVSKVDVFAYPDLLHWVPPRSQLEAVGVVEGELELAGLGRINTVTDPVRPDRSADDALWQWARLGFGQHIPVKRREQPHPLSPESRSNPDGRTSATGRRLVRVPGDRVHRASARSRADAAVQEALFSPLDDRRRSDVAGDRSLDAVIDWLRRRDFVDRAVGQAVRQVAMYGSREDLAFLTASIWHEIRIRRNRRATSADDSQ